MISLRKVYTAFERRCQTFLRLTQEAKSSSGAARDVRIAHVVIGLQTALAYVSRSTYLAGTVGGWRANGIRMRGMFSDSPSALMAAAKVIKPKASMVPGRDEPSWQSPDHMMRVANAIHPLNSIAFANATSAFPDTLALATASRNFYAHRGQHTREEVERQLSVRMAISARGHLTDVLIATNRGGSPLLELWIWNYLDVAELLCER